MANKTIKTRIQHKRELEANWRQSSFVPLEGELIIYLKEVDKDGNTLTLPEGRTVPYTYDRFKIGDGHSTVNELGFIGSEIAAGTTDPDASTLSKFYFKYQAE